MFLKRLKLTNVRCFKSLELDFEKEPKYSEKTGKILKSSLGQRNWTLILGENGTGKSTILRSIALLTAGSDSLSQLLGTPEYWIYQNAGFARIEGTIETKDRKERSVALEIHRGDSVSSFFRRSNDQLVQLDEAIMQSERNYFTVAYGASRRLNVSGIHGKSSGRGRTHRFESIKTLFNADEKLVPLQSWAMEMDYRRGNKATKAIKDVLSDFLPDVTFLKIDKEAKEMIFKTKDGEVPLSGLSDGYQNVSAWVGDLLFRIFDAFDDYKDPLKTRGLLIIDEIDLHLHPVWQRRLYDFLSKKLPNFQIVATTHSPVTSQQADTNELFVLKRFRGKISVNQFSADPSDFLVSQLLASELFGFDTDESLDTEKKKKRYIQLTQQKRRTKMQDEELKRLSSRIVKITTSSSKVVGENKEIEILREIKRKIVDSKE